MRADISCLPGALARRFGDRGDVILALMSVGVDAAAGGVTDHVIAHSYE